MKFTPAIYRLILIGLLLPASQALYAQSGAGTLAETQAALIDSTETYQQATQDLIALQEKEVQTASARLEQLRELADDGLIARNDVEMAEEILKAAQGKLEMSRHQNSEAKQLISKVTAESQQAQAVASAGTPPLYTKPIGTYSSSGAIIRYTTPTMWTPSGLGNIQSFFKSKFGRTLPVSAMGQSSTHNSMGFNHRNAADVALHPDSAEGRAVIDFLRANGIPFLAFRSAVPGAATGPHIHIGQPSHKL